MSESDDEAIKEYLTNMKNGRLHPRINVTNCEELRDAVDEFCSFDADTVSLFTKDVKNNGGNWTMVFWIRPKGTVSLDHRGQFVPTMTFWSSLSPPKHHLSIGRW